MNALPVSKSIPADSVDVTRGDNPKNMGNLKYSVSHLQKEISSIGMVYNKHVEVQCQTAKIDKKIKRCILVRKAQIKTLQKCDKKNIIQRQI